MNAPVNPPIRIISDLHFGHTTSFVRDPAQLAPILEGAGQVIFPCRALVPNLPIGNAPVRESPIRKPHEGYR